ncbi:MAG: flavin reductase family protein [Pyrinomonadaceae bacterium]
MIENPDQLLKLINVGVYVIGVRDGERQNAFTAAWVMQISFDPILLAIAVNPKNYSCELLKAGGICTVNVLADNQSKIAGHFGNSFLSVPDKMDGYTWRAEVTGAPILANSLAYFECKVTHWDVTGSDPNYPSSHRLAICEVVEGKQLNTGTPMLYTQTGTLDGSSELYNV